MSDNPEKLSKKLRIAQAVEQYTKLMKDTPFAGEFTKENETKINELLEPIVGRRKVIKISSPANFKYKEGVEVKEVHAYERWDYKADNLGRTGMKMESWRRCGEQARELFGSNTAHEIRRQAMEGCPHELPIMWDRDTLCRVKVMVDHFGHGDGKAKKVLDILQEAFREGLGVIEFTKKQIRWMPIPKTLAFDDDSRWHSLEGPACEFQDNEGPYYIHGVDFKKEHWEKFTSGELDAEKIMEEPNQDKRRVLIMAYGNEKLIKELNAETVKSQYDDEGNMMKILRIQRGGRDLVFYEGMDNSKMEKVYLRIPPEFTNRTPCEAKLWTFAPLWEEYQKTGVIPKFEKET